MFSRSCAARIVGDSEVIQVGHRADKYGESACTNGRMQILNSSQLSSPLSWVHRKWCTSR